MYQPIANYPSACRWCGAAITQPRYGIRFYCSHHCRTAGYRAGLRPKVGHQAEQVCATCGGMFFSCMRVTRYCSTACWTAGQEHQAYEASGVRKNARLANAQRYYHRHTSARKSYNRQYHQRHRERLNERSRTYFAQHRDRENARRRMHYQTHRDADRERDNARRRASYALKKRSGMDGQS